MFFSALSLALDYAGSAAFIVAPEVTAMAHVSLVELSRPSPMGAGINEGHISLLQHGLGPRSNVSMGECGVYREVR